MVPQHRARLALPKEAVHQFTARLARFTFRSKGENSLLSQLEERNLLHPCDDVTRIHEHTN